MTSLDRLTEAAKKHGWTVRPGRYEGANDVIFERPNVTDRRKIEYIYVSCSVRDAVIYASWAPGLDGVNGRQKYKGARAFVMQYLTRTAENPATNGEAAMTNDDLRDRLERFAATLEALADNSAAKAQNPDPFQRGVDAGRTDAYRWVANRIRGELNV